MASLCFLSELIHLWFMFPGAQTTCQPVWLTPLRAQWIVTLALASRRSCQHIRPPQPSVCHAAAGSHPGPQTHTLHSTAPQHGILTGQLQTAQTQEMLHTHKTCGAAFPRDLIRKQWDNICLIKLNKVQQSSVNSTLVNHLLKMRY